VRIVVPRLLIAVVSICVLTGLAFALPDADSASVPAGAAVAHAFAAPGRVARPVAPAREAALPIFDPREVRLPVSSSWALPPMIRLRASATPAAHTAALRRRVLRSPHLLLAPAARRSVRDGRTSSSALELLSSIPRLGAPLLVFSAQGRDLRVQATTQWMTRRALQTLVSLRGARRPSQLFLRATASSSADHAAPHGGQLGAQAVAIAERYLGIPYVWGSANPKVGLDCSGLTMLVYGKLGVTLDHYAAFQWLEGERIAPDKLIAGDLVFFHMKPDGPGHVGLYAGNGQFIQAPHTGDVVKISTLRDYASSYIGAVRPYS
jgi:cell wall-associated NlpC family hydrolase